MKQRFTVIKETWNYRHFFALLASSICIISGVITIQNFAALTWFYSVSGSFWHTVTFFIALHGGLFTLFSPIGTIAIFSLAGLVSMNVILIVQFVRQQRLLTAGRFSKRAAAHNVGSTIAVVLGIGCASCGYAVLFSVLSVFGATGLITYLPLHGEELSILGIFGLCYSNWYLLDKLSSATVCKVRTSK